MKMDERRALRDLTREQMTTQLAESERKLLDLRFDAGMNRPSNPGEIHKTRKRIATLKTLLREQELLTDSGFRTMDEYKAFKTTERGVFRANRKATR